MAVIEEQKSTTNTVVTPQGETKQARPAAKRRPHLSPESISLTSGLPSTDRSALKNSTDSNPKLLGLIYTVLLGGAACLALAGVVSQSQTTDAGSPDSPPPAVLIQGD